MKFGVVCNVEGKTYLQNGGTIEHEGSRYIFYINDEGLLKQIRVIANVNDPESYFYQRTDHTDGTATITRGYEEEIKTNSSANFSGLNLRSRL